jgi:hypothetical protein
MNRLFLTGMMALSLNAVGQQIPAGYESKLLHAVYLAEGGSKTRFAYGVMLHNRPWDEPEARLIAQNTIEHRWRLYEASGAKGSFVDYLAKTWCPASVDPVGHRNWIHNVTALMKK